MEPENYVPPPNLGELLASPSSEQFWTESETTLKWLWYLWTGPNPSIKVELHNTYPLTRLSAQTIYQNIIDAVEQLKIPGVRYGPRILHESGLFSAYRAYLQIRREFSEFLVCAAPVGESYFLAVRKIDRFPHVKWFHYLPVFGLIGMAFLQGVVLDGLMGGFLVMAMFITLVWTIFRYGSHSARNWFSEHLHEIPWIGPIYLRWFRPDTFYQQDIHVAFLTLVDGVIKTVIANIEQAQPTRPPAGALGGPVRGDLHTST